MGADSAVTSDGLLWVSCVPKIFELEDFVVGVTGSIEIGQYISRDFRILDRPPNTGLARYMIAHFGPALQKAIKREALQGDYSALTWLERIFGASAIEFEQIPDKEAACAGS